VILFLTDGDADISGSVPLLRTMGSSFKTQKFMFFGVGFGNGVRMNVLKDLSIAANGSDKFQIGTDFFHYMYSAENSQELHDAFNTIVNCTTVEVSQTLHAVKLLTAQIANERNILSENLNFLSQSLEKELETLQKYRDGELSTSDSSLLAQRYKEIKDNIKQELDSLKIHQETLKKEKLGNRKEFTQTDSKLNTTISGHNSLQKNWESQKDTVNKKDEEHIGDITAQKDETRKFLFQSTGYSDPDDILKLADQFVIRQTAIRAMFDVVEEVTQLLNRVRKQVGYLADIFDPYKVPIKNFYEEVFKVCSATFDSMPCKNTAVCIKQICEAHATWEDNLSEIYKPIISILNEGDIDKICGTTKDCEALETQLVEKNQKDLKQFTNEERSIKEQMQTIKDKLKQTEDDKLEKNLEDLEAKLETVQDKIVETREFNKALTKNVSVLFRVLQQTLGTARQKVLDTKLALLVSDQAKSVCQGFMITSTMFNSHPMLTNKRKFTHT